MADDSREGSSGNTICESESAKQNEPPRRRPDRDELERRLAEFELDVRAQVAAEEERRRLATPLEAREFVSGIVPPQAHVTSEGGEAKVMLAAGVDPRRDPTLIGQRNGRGDTWTLGVLEGEIVSEDEPATEPLPAALEKGALDIEDSAAPGEGRRRKIIVCAAGLVSLLAVIWFGMQHQSRSPAAVSTQPANPSPAAPPAPSATPSPPSFPLDASGSPSGEVPSGASPDEPIDGDGGATAPGRPEWAPSPTGANKWWRARPSANETEKPERPLGGKGPVY